MKNLIQFPRAKDSKWFDIKNATDESADVFIYDVVGDSWIGTDAGTFVKQLNALKTKKINLRINSPGGSVFDGMAIYNALARHPAEVTSYVDGLAASIASVIALAGKKIVIAENAMMMIHDPSVLAFGKAEELRKSADVLDQIKETIINTYATRTGLKRDEIAQMMTDETWFTAQEAIAKKFADESTPGVKAAAQFDLSSFGYSKAPAASDGATATHTDATASIEATISATTPTNEQTPARLYKRRLDLLEKLTK
jgi:ATP-dependent Clp endopeptidase proteolytic subunit ClpP